MERASAEARNLESMLNAMVENLLQKTEDATASYETAVGNVVARASYEAQEILSMLTDAAASSASISSDLVSRQTVPPNFEGS